MLMQLIACGNIVNSSNTVGNKISNAENSNGLPISKEKITLTGLGYLSSLYVNIKDYNDLPAIQELEKRTNINIKWQMVNQANGGEQTDLIFASKKLPDIFTALNNVTAYKYGHQGALMPLNDLIDKYAPHIKAVIDKHPELKPMIYSPDGKIYMIPQIDENYKLSNFLMFMIRKDWLDKLNLQVPQTTDDWYNVLKAFKENQSRLNPNTKIIPFSSYVGTGIVAAFGWSWGILGTGGYYIKDGSIHFPAFEPQYRDVLAYVNKLYKEGLIDQEFDTVKDDANYDAKMSNNRIGAAFIGEGRIVLYNKAMQSKYPGFELIPVLPPKGPNGIQNYGWVGPLAHTGIGFAISRTNKYPVESIKLIDYLFSTEGSLLMNFGIEGKSYMMKNGEPEYTDEIMNNTKLGPTKAILQYTPINDFPFLRMYAFEKQLYGPKVVEYKTQMEKMGLLKAPSAVDVSTLPLTDSQMQEVLPLLNDVNTYVSEMIPKFVRGQIDLNKGYDDFVKKLKQMGAGKILDIYNEAYQKSLQNNK